MYTVDASPEASPGCPDTPAADCGGREAWEPEPMELFPDGIGSCSDAHPANIPMQNRIAK